MILSSRVTTHALATACYETPKTILYTSGKLVLHFLSITLNCNGQKLFVTRQINYVNEIHLKINSLDYRVLGSLTARGTCCSVESGRHTPASLPCDTKVIGTPLVHYLLEPFWDWQLLAECSHPHPAAGFGVLWAHTWCPLFYIGRVYILQFSLSRIIRFNLQLVNLMMTFKPVGMSLLWRPTFFSKDFSQPPAFFFCLKGEGTCSAS